MTAAESAEPSALKFWGAGRDRVARAGLDLVFSPITESQLELVVDVHCQRTRPNGTSYRKWHDFFEGDARVMALADTTVVATAASDGVPVILGFASVTEAGALRMVYVKLQFRGHGIGLRLLEVAGVDVPVRVVAPERGWARWAAYHGLPWRVA